MKEDIKSEKSYFPAGWIYGAGFLLGVLIPNIIWKTAWNQKAAASVYLLSVFAGRKPETGQYLLQVLKIRAGVFILAALCGLTVYGVVISVAGLFMGGMLLGMVFTMSVLEFGIPGCAVGAGLVFPQYILYIPCMLKLFAEVYRQSAAMWKGHGEFPRHMAGYWKHILLYAAGYGFGIFLEIYCNPPVMELLMKTIDIF